MKSILSLIVFFASTTAFAGNINYGPDQSLLIQSINTIDLDKDGINDVAMIANPEKQAQEDLDLWFWISSEDEYYKVEGSILSGDMMVHSLQENSAGSLQVISNNEYTVSRGLFTITMTFAYRNNSVVLAGYTYSEADRHFPEQYSVCDANILTKQGVLNTDQGNGTFEMNEGIALEEIYYSNMYDLFKGPSGYCSGFEFGEDGDL